MSLDQLIEKSSWPTPLYFVGSVGSILDERWFEETPYGKDRPMRGRSFETVDGDANGSQ